MYLTQMEGVDMAMKLDTVLYSGHFGTFCNLTFVCVGIGWDLLDLIDDDSCFLLCTHVHSGLIIMIWNYISWVHRIILSAIYTTLWLEPTW